MSLFRTMVLLNIIYCTGCFKKVIMELGKVKKRGCSNGVVSIIEFLTQTT